MKNNPDLSMRVLVHAHNERVSFANFNKEMVVLAWQTGGCMYRLSLCAETWFGSITMRAFKQSDTFSIVGSDDPPELGPIRPTCPQYQFSEGDFETVIPNMEWATYIAAIPTVTPIKVEKSPETDCFHERLDLRDFLLRYADHFRARDFRSGTCSFVLRAAADVEDDFNRWDFGDMLTEMAHVEDAIEFAWVEAQMKSKWQLLLQNR